MRKTYIYPISARINRINSNPYLEDFMNSLQKNFVFLNREKPSDKGLLDVFGYISEMKYIFFHWPENIPDRKFGLFQTMMFFLLSVIFRLKGIRMIYVLHNKISHSKRRLFLKRFISHYLIKHSYRILTHASDGVEFVNDISRRRDKDVFYFPHPVKEIKSSPGIVKTIDVLIWGIIAPYKGVDRFVSQLAAHENGRTWNVVIAGKVAGDDYLDVLLRSKPGNVRIINEYIKEEELDKLIRASRIVLFPYHKDSVLSSGAFARTFVFPVAIIGPDCGSFRDFSDLPGVFVFRDEFEIIPLIEKVLSSGLVINPGHSDVIIKKYSWEMFGEEFERNLS